MSFAPASYQYGFGSGVGGAPVVSAPHNTYGQYNYYKKPVVIGRPIGGGSPPIIGGSGSSTSQTGNSDAEAFFKQVMSGEKLPFSPFAKSQMMSQQSDMAAAAEAAQNKQLGAMAQAGGASAMDPSFKAAQRGNMARRQTQNQQSARDIDVATNQQNFSAQMAAAEALNRNAMQRAAWEQQMMSGGAGGVDFSPWGSGRMSQGGGGQSTPSTFVGGYQIDPTAYMSRPDANGVMRPGPAYGVTNPWVQSTINSWNKRDPYQRAPGQTSGIIPPGATSGYD